MEPSDKLFGDKKKEVSADEFAKAFMISLDGIPGTTKRDTSNFVPKGKFGYEPTNPIMANGIARGYAYLAQLKRENGDDIKYVRIGSFSSGLDELPRAVDGYAIVNARTGAEICILYNYAYSHDNSMKTPDGFRFK